jgi:archaellum component FlaF (FlaF/FlaG flagellin family)
VIFVILAAVGINSCESSALTSSLTNYANGVSSIIQQSNTSSGTLFGTDLGTAPGVNGAQALRNKIESVNGPLGTANKLLQQAQSLSVPDQMSNAQHNVLVTLQLRRDGIRTIAARIEQALGNSTNVDALQAIAAAMAGFLGSDVLYKEYAAKEIAEQLHADGIPIAIGATSGVSLPAGQFLPNLAWLEIPYLANKLGAKYNTTSTNSAGNSNLPVQPGLHGHSLNSVSVSNTTLNPNASNAVPASPAPTFVLNLTNGGHFAENNVTCKVTVQGTSISGINVIPQTTPGETTTCSVPLNKAPSPGQYQVTASVAAVPGEGNKTNNTLVFPITFQ